MSGVRDHLVGVLSDTHGLLRPSVVEALQGVELIIHAGDVGQERVLEALRAIAPLRAVRGNVDRGEWARRLPETEVVVVGDGALYVLHDLHDLDLNPRTAGFAAVISGHSHRPAIRERDGVLFINPGSAGPRRFGLLVSVVRLWVRGEALEAELVDLTDQG
jgi:hypothetical protein